MLGQLPALAPAQRPHPDQSEQRRQQGDGGGHGQHDGQRRGEGDAVEEAQPQDQHAQQRDTDGGPGEDDRPPGHRGRADGGLLDRQPRPQALAVPGDDEQRIVDADAEPDQHAEHRGEVGDGHGVAEQGDAGRGGPDGGQRGDDRQEGRGERPEGEEEHHGRGTEPDDFRELGARRLGERDPGAAQLDLKAAAGRAPRGVDDLLDLGGVQLVGGAAEEHGGVGGVPVLADLPPVPPAGRVGAGPAVGAPHRGDAGQLGDLLQGVRHRPADCGGAHRCGVRVPHDAVAVPGLPGEGPVQQGRRPPGFGPGDLVVVRVRGPRHSRGDGDPREGGEPENDHDDAAPETPPSQSGHGPRLLPGLCVDSSRERAVPSADVRGTGRARRMPGGSGGLPSCAGCQPGEIL